MLAKLLSLGAAFLFFSGAMLHAQTVDSNVKVTEVAPAKNKPEGQDVDEIITNAKLRAQTGSKSKYSISTGVSYSGGSLARPFGSVRPNITGGTGSTDFSSLGASVSGRYAMTTTSAFSAGIGGRMITPLMGLASPDSYHGNKFDVDSPSASYQYLYRWSGIQSALGISETFVTTSDLRRRGYLTSWGFSQNNVYDFANTGFTIGLSTYVNLAYFDRNDPVYKTGQSDYSWGLTPALEYRLSEKASLHFDTNLFTYEHIRSFSTPWTFQRDSVSQNFGFGYAITRDFFISPGVSFVARNLKLNTTTWSVGCNLNLF